MAFTAWTTPRTWVANDRMTAGTANSHLRDNPTALKEISDKLLTNTAAGTALPGSVFLMDMSGDDRAFTTATAAHEAGGSTRVVIAQGTVTPGAQGYFREAGFTQVRCDSTAPVNTWLETSTTPGVARVGTVNPFAWVTRQSGTTPECILIQHAPYNPGRVAVRKNSAGSIFQRRRLNVIEGSGVTLTVGDDAANEEVDITIAASSAAGHSIEDEGSPLTTRTKLNFVGAGVTVTDDSGDDASVVTIPGGSGGETLISEHVATGSAGTATFSTIPGTYRHLRLRIWGRGDQAGQASQELRLRMNGDTGSNYQDERVIEFGATRTPARQETTYTNLGFLPTATATTSYPGHYEVFIPNYAGTAFFHSFSCYGGYSTATGDLAVIVTLWGQWRAGSAITSLDVFMQAGNFVSGTLLQLYGVA